MRRITKAGFRRWLMAMKRERRPVGIAHAACNCPLANYIGENCEVQYDYAVTRAKGKDGVWHYKSTVITPLWSIRFMKAVDAELVAGTRVSATRALDILDEVA